MPLIQYGQFESVSDVMTRITEASDTRITEAGDIRITNDEIGNTGVSSLVADPTFTKFSSEPYVKQDGDWHLFTPYVKHNGTWKEPEIIYKKISGQWKRVY
jgi:hypothetical protein